MHIRIQKTVFFFAAAICAFLPLASHADNFLFADTSPVFSGGAGYWPAFSPFSMGTAAETAPHPFVISRIKVDHNDFSMNNHDGAGYISAWLYGADGATPIASSTNSFYSEGAGGDQSFNFDPAPIPQDFTTEIVASGAQGGSSFTIYNLRFYEHALGMDTSTLSQYEADGATSISTGATTTGAIVFAAAIDSSSTEPAELQVEVRPSLLPFTGTPTATSSAVDASGRTETMPIKLRPGSYHWQARAADVDGNVSAWQPFNETSSSADFTVLKPDGVREPVVIVPGIMGSVLDRASDEKEIWPDANGMIASVSDGYLDALNLSPLGEEIPGNEMYAVDIVRKVTTAIPFVEKDFFGPLVDSFTNAGYVAGRDLFVAPYDWRLDIASSADAVGAVIERAAAASPDGEVNVIAHSMGGLAVKQYLAETADTSFVDKLVLAGVPQLGAPDIFKTLEYGDNLGFGAGPIQLLNPQEIKSIAQNMPAAYELLPSRRYMEVNGGYVTDLRNGVESPLSFDATNELMTSVATDTRNGGLLARADSFHAALDGSPVNAPAVYNLVGCENPTTTGFIIGNRGTAEILRGNGDGDVPVDSAMNLANGYENYFLLHPETGIDHTGLIANDQSIVLIDAIIADKTSTISLDSSGISRSTADCFGAAGQFGEPTTIEISTHSPVALNVYDAAGNHTGPNASGTIDLQIPGSSYETIGENSFILVPADDTYRIETDGLSAGVFTLEVKWYDDAVHLLQDILYPQVPLASTSTTATALISNTMPTSSLALDSDGDGTTDTTIEPEIFSASSSDGLDPLPIADSFLSISALSDPDPGATTSTAVSSSDTNSSSDTSVTDTSAPSDASSTAGTPVTDASAPSPLPAPSAGGAGGGGGGAGYGVSQAVITGSAAGSSTSEPAAINSVANTASSSVDATSTNTMSNIATIDSATDAPREKNAALAIKTKMPQASSNADATSNVASSGTEDAMPDAEISSTTTSSVASSTAAPLLASANATLSGAVDKKLAEFLAPLAAFLAVAYGASRVIPQRKDRGRKNEDATLEP
ncbi:MAG TPA: hypothetical protein VNG29_04245 [Candidatus Paceibacterota bacterium]|nr:hypothetical protein [Candidatus Paceibacterota bacterium]